MDNIGLNGRTYRLFERHLHTVVRIADELERLNDNIEGVAGLDDSEDSDDGE